MCNLQDRIVYDYNFGKNQTEETSTQATSADISRNQLTMTDVLRDDIMTVDDFKN